MTARAAGTALVVACAAACGESDGTTAVVQPPGSSATVASVTATPSSHTFTRLGDIRLVAAVARNVAGDVVSNAALRWTSSHPSIVSVDTLGQMTARSAGTASIIVTAICCVAADTIFAHVAVQMPAPPSSSMYFADNFDNGRLNSANGFAWSNADTNVTISSDQAYSGRYSMRFRFGPDADGQDSSAEERFTITANASTAPTETWIEFMWRIPENYVHRNSSGPDNNKFMTLWAENYSTANEAQFYLSLELDAAGQTKLWAISIHGDDPRYQKAEKDIPGNGGVFITPADRGKWVQIRVHARLAVDGSIHVWKNGTLVTAVTNYNMVRAGYNWDYFRRGYLMGWANSGYTEQTDFFVDDFKLYTSNPGW